MYILCTDLGADWSLFLSGNHPLGLIGCCFLQGTSSWLWLATVSYRGPVLGSDWLLSLTGDQFLALIGYCLLQWTSSWLWLATVSYRGPVLGCDWLLFLTGNQLLAVIGYCFLQGTSSWLWLAIVSYREPALGSVLVESTWWCRRESFAAILQICACLFGVRIYILKSYIKIKKPYQDWKRPSWTWLFQPDLSSITIQIN